MSSKNDMKLGLFIIVAGIVIVLGKLGVFGYLGRNLWPLVILLPGLYLHVLFFSRRASAVVLIPAGILTVYGLLFGLCNTWGWGLMKYLWPVLLLGVAVGLFEYAVNTSSRSSGLTGTSGILALLSLVLLIFSLLGTGALYVLGAVLIAAGVWLISGIGKSKNGRKSSRGW